MTIVLKVFIHDDGVCLSVRTSVCNAVNCGPQGRRRSVESYTVVYLARHSLFTSSVTFAVRCIVYPQNTAISNKLQLYHCLLWVTRAYHASVSTVDSGITNLTHDRLCALKREQGGGKDRVTRGDT